MNTKIFHRIALILTVLVFAVSLTGCGNSAQGKVVNEIMQHLAAHDATAAFEHMSQVSRDEGITADALTAFIEQYAVLVDGYKSMSVTSMNVSTSDAETKTEMSGTFSYEDGTSSQFDALLHKEGENWFVTELNINK
jgi:outer membrane PBP1 activator LpoA protein